MRARCSTLLAAGLGLSAAAALSALLVLPAGASRLAGAGRPEIPTLTIMASDHALEAPAQVAAGATRIEVMNHGTEAHQAALVRLEPGRTRDEYLTALAQSLAAAAEVGTFVGGPNGAGPGQTVGVTAELEPGRHVVLCLIPSLDGVPHVVKGMVTELEVTGPAGKPAPRERAAAVRLHDFHFGVPKRFVDAVSSGEPIEVVNDGAQAHEMVVSRLPKGVTIADVVTWTDHPLFTPAPGPQPQVDVAGVTMLAPGASSRVRLDLAPGRYALLCFLPDEASGTSHLEQGMAYPFTVGQSG
jgi:hypothetical protein